MPAKSLFLCLVDLTFVGAILVAAGVTVTLYNVNVVNAQSSNITKIKTMTGPNMTKTANVTAAGGGNMTAAELGAYSQCLTQREICNLF